MGKFISGVIVKGKKFEINGIENQINFFKLNGHF